MKIMMVTNGQPLAFPVVSIDDNNWYKISDLLPDANLNSSVEILVHYQDNPGLFAETINRMQATIEAVDIDAVTKELPFQPLSYRDFMLYEEHYINAKRGFITKYMPHLLPIINIYERVANQTFPKLKPEKRWYQYPIYYLGNHLTFVKSQSKIAKPPYTAELDYELELGAVLCRKIKNASTDEAKEAIGGFVVFNDFSARDVQADEMKCGFGPMKAKNFANSISDVLVTADEILPNIDKLKVRVLINGQLIMATDTSNIHYSLAEAIAYASWEEQLFPGEFVATGTIPGCTGIENGTMLQSGDTIRLEIEGIGSLENQVT
ncbi:MAG: fumarylacetoacetate hydrolase family protein [Gammaproteobacteria bacterium]|nr:MAG: fumarylacetoacetate hydrolase family protein [Gammaproteobacteria bacterium]